MISQGHKGAVHYPYFRRTDSFDTKSDNIKSPCHRYTLLGIARNDVYGTDVFLHYFQSLYTRQYEDKKWGNTDRLQKSHVSQFFFIFVKMVTFKNIISINRNITGAVSLILSYIFNIHSLNQSQKRLASLIKNEVEEIYERQQATIVKAKKGEYLEIAIIYENKIDKLLAAFYNDLQDAKFFQRIKQTEFLQEKFDAKYVRRNFECLRNLHLFCKNIRKDILEQFYSTNKGYMPLKIPFIMDNLKEIDNTIVLPKYTQQFSYAITKMHIYINFQAADSDRNALNSVSQFRIRQIAQICLNYHKYTNRVYPMLSMDSIFFDQKKMQPVVSYVPILEDAVGIKKQTKCVQLMIATQPTPFINFEQSYLETIPENKVLANRKYYCPISKSSRQEDEEINAETIKRQKKLMQQAHVWRLIQAIYFIQNHRYFTNDYYNDRLQVKGSKCTRVQRPFYYKQYKKMLKQIYEKIQNGSLPIEKIIPQRTNPKDMMKSDSEESWRFNLDIDSIRKYLNILDDDDSLLESLKFQKLKKLIHERHILMKEFNLLILHPHYFKKMINPKKYFVIYFLHCYDEAFIKKIIRDKEKEIMQKELSEIDQVNHKGLNQQSNPESVFRFIKKSLMEQLQQYTLKANLSREFQKRKVLKNETQKKIETYLERNDSSGDYVRKHNNYYQAISKIKELFNLVDLYSSIQKNGQIQENYEERMDYLTSLNPFEFKTDQQIKQLLERCKDIRQQQKLKGKMKEESERVCHAIYRHTDDCLGTTLSNILQLVTKILIQFVTNEIQGDFKTPQKLHSAPDNMAKQALSALCNFNNIKFKVLIETLYYLDEALLTYYKPYSGFLVEEALGSQRKVKKLQLGEIVTMTGNLLLFRKKILKITSPNFII